MAKLGMNGPYPLTNIEIDKRVSKSVGNYALGKDDPESFKVHYVGRSDNDLNERLKKWVGKYTDFKFSQTATTPIAAWKKECHNYHDFGGSAVLDNDIHPARPEGYDKPSNPCPHKGCKE